MARVTSRIKEGPVEAPAGLVAKEVAEQALGKDAKFTIVELTPGGVNPVYDGAGEIIKFANGKDAAALASKLTDKGKSKFQPRPILSDGWKEREAARMGKGYTLLPWHNERWWQDLKHVWEPHFPHVAIYKGARIAFTESAEKGAADIQTPIKPGKYLENYFGGAKGLLSNYVVRDLCTVFSAKFEDGLLLWADTEEEIEDIYVNGPNSCMSKTKDQYLTKGLHPVRVYASPDIKIAYLMRDGRVTARSVVDVVNKRFNSVYGDAGRLSPLLKKEGYTPGPPLGARLKRVILWEKGEGKGGFVFVTPHLDGAGFIEDRGDPDYLFIAGGNPDSKIPRIDCSGARGITEQLVKGCLCNKDKSFPAKSGKSIYTSADTKDVAMCCPSCVTTHAVKCIHSGYYVSKDAVTWVGRDGKSPIWNHYGASLIETCSIDGKQYYKGHMITSPVDGSRVFNDNFHRDYRPCGTCGKWCKKSDKACSHQTCASKAAYDLKMAKAKSKPDTISYSATTSSGTIYNGGRIR